MKIDERLYIPIGWVISGFSVIMGALIIGIFWVAAVNFRLQRIEERMGIPVYHSSEVITETRKYAAKKPNTPGPVPSPLEKLAAYDEPNSCKATESNL